MPVSVVIRPGNNLVIYSNVDLDYARSKIENAVNGLRPVPFRSIEFRITDGGNPLWDTRF